MFVTIILAFTYLFLATGEASADPITATAVVTFLVRAVIQVAIGLAVSYGVNKLFGKKEKKQRESGAKLQVTTGDNEPLSFIMGYFPTAGTRKYTGAWGSVGGTPNAYLTDVIQVGDMPAPGQPEVFLNGEKLTLLLNQGTVKGFPALEYRKNGKDYLWVKYSDGTNTVADSYLTSKFGADPVRPWKSTMIGRGTPFAMLTTRFNRDLFKGAMDFLIHPPSIPLYDITKDSTNGGSGSHRWNDQSTWEPSHNTAVIIYNIIRGVYYNGVWVFGGRNLPSFKLPSANWIAAVNECNIPIVYQAVTQPQFRSGVEIFTDQDALAYCEELAKGCAGTLCEVGGIFKLNVGAPNSSVYSFTDDDILVTEGQGFEPFPRSGQIYNAIDATYPSPDEGWVTKNSPPIYNAVFEAEDNGERLIFSANLETVPFRRQVQRLARAALKDHRRFRTHHFFLPPDAWALEAGVDTVSWTSARNGYANKKFTIIEILGHKNFNQEVIIKEVDPADYDFDQADELPETLGPTGPVRPPAQEMTGWQATPAILDETRPSIKVSFAGELDDVASVSVQVKNETSGDVVFDGTIPYDITIVAPAIILNGVFLPNEDYEVRGKFIPFSGRDTNWSAWLAVTTPDVKLSISDFDLEAFREIVRSNRAEIDRLRDIVTTDGFQATILSTANSYLQRRTIQKTAGNALARVTLEEQVRAQEDDALAALILSAQAQIDNATATGLFKVEAVASPSGVDVRLALFARAAIGTELYKEAGIFIDVNLTSGGGQSGIILSADSVSVVDSSGNVLGVFSSNGKLLTARIPNLSADIITTGEMHGNRITVDSMSVNRVNGGIGAFEELLVDDGFVANHQKSTNTFTIAVNTAGYESVDIDFTGEISSYVPTGGPHRMTLYYGSRKIKTQDLNFKLASGNGLNTVSAFFSTNGASSMVFKVAGASSSGQALVGTWVNRKIYGRRRK